MTPTVPFVQRNASFRDSSMSILDQTKVSVTKLMRVYLKQTFMRAPFLHPYLTRVPEVLPHVASHVSRLYLRNHFVASVLRTHTVHHHSPLLHLDTVTSVWVQSRETDGILEADVEVELGKIPTVRYAQHVGSLCFFEESLCFGDVAVVRSAHFLSPRPDKSSTDDLALALDGWKSYLWEWTGGLIGSLHSVTKRSVTRSSRIGIRKHSRELTRRRTGKHLNGWFDSRLWRSIACRPLGGIPGNKSFRIKEKDLRYWYLLYGKFRPGIPLPDDTLWPLTRLQTPDSVR